MQWIHHRSTPRCGSQFTFRRKFAVLSRNRHAHLVPAVSLLGDPATTDLLHRTLVAGALTLAFTAAARFVRGVTWSGAVAGAAVSFLLFLGAGSGAFLTLISVFVLTLLATRLGYSHKKRLGVAQQKDGRTASQVLANLGVAAAMVLIFQIHSHRVFLLACVAALAEATADTVSSEIGQTRSSMARLITTWKSVPAGTDGGITLVGTLAGVFAALAVSAVASSVRLVTWPDMVIIICAATFGMFFDSWLGAWLERRALLNNDHVNFLGTLAAAGIAFLVAGPLGH